MHSEPNPGSPANLLWIAITAIAVLTWCFGSQTWSWYEAKKMGESQPCLKLGVRPMIIGNADAAPGTKEAFFGYEFEVPWSHADAKVTPKMVTLAAANGHGLILWDPTAIPQLFGDATKQDSIPTRKMLLAWWSAKKQPSLTTILSNTCST
jgi:hypothetical protein